MNNNTNVYVDLHKHFSTLGILIAAGSASAGSFLPSFGARAGMMLFGFLAAFASAISIWAVQVLLETGTESKLAKTISPGWVLIISILSNLFVVAVDLTAPDPVREFLLS